MSENGTGIYFVIGDKVKINLLELNGYITAICLRLGNTSYEVSYFSNGDYQQKWFENFEIETI
jgi:hypothetical protein